MDKLAVGTRVLYSTHPGGPIHAGVIEEYSPSGNFVGLSHDYRAGDWFALNTLNLVEVLEEAKVEAPTSTVPIVDFQKAKEAEVAAAAAAAATKAEADAKAAAETAKAPADTSTGIAETVGSPLN